MPWKERQRICNGGNGMLASGPSTVIVDCVVLICSYSFG